MDDDSAGDEARIGDVDIASECDIVCDDYAIAQPAIVSYVGACHYEAVRSNDGFRAGLGPAMHCDVFSNPVSRSDSQKALAFRVAEVLRLTPKNHAFINSVVRIQS